MIFCYFLKAVTLCIETYWKLALSSCEVGEVYFCISILTAFHNRFYLEGTLTIASISNFLKSCDNMRQWNWALSSDWIHNLLLWALWPWASYVNSINLNFPINEMMLIIVSTSGVVVKVKWMSSFNTPQGSWWWLNKCLFVLVAFNEKDAACDYAFLCVCVHFLHIPVPSPDFEIYSLVICILKIIYH